MASLPIANSADASKCNKFSFDGRKLLANDDLFLRPEFEFRYVEQYYHQPQILIMGTIIACPRASNGYHYQLQWDVSTIGPVDPSWLLDSIPTTDRLRCYHLRRAIQRFDQVTSK